MKRSALGAAVLGAVAAFGFALSAEAKTLVYCSEASPEGFNPQLFTSGTTLDATKPLYNNLVEFIVGTTRVQPALAEKWSISDDGLTYTFMLRKGVKFHGKSFTGTRDFNADDVLFSFERQLDKNNPYYKVSGGTYEYFNDMDMPNIIKSVDKVDDYTELREFAAALGLSLGAINPNLFQEQDYRLGSVCNPDPRIRRLAIDHIDLYQTHGNDPLTPIHDIALRSLPRPSRVPLRSNSAVVGSVSTRFRPGPSTRRCCAATWPA